ncbi:hypothetical protein SAY86_009989 [Trapa natans]|uniref:DUF4378 domain-containing protein n=1 Tax=Trapa natans TaxID=22666 RepID=A0AAN7QQ37_TRANT|nr:hypothetical protein SAY86_009989 [Trapa natans]
MPQHGRRSVGYRPFVTCDDPRGVVECGTVRKSNKPSFRKSNSSGGAVERGELSEVSFQLSDISKGAQKLNHVIESWSNGMSLEGQPKYIAKDLLRGALDLQESLMVLGKLQAASSYMARLKRKEEKLKNSATPTPTTSDDGHGREVGFARPEASSCDRPSKKKKIEELREAIRMGLTKQSQSSSVNFDGKKGMVPDKKAKALKASNIIARLMGLEEISSEPKQGKMQDKKIAMNMQRHDSGDVELKMKRPEFEIQVEEPNRKTLKEVLDRMQSKGHLKSSSIRKTPVSSADDIPPIVLIKPSSGCLESSKALQEGNGDSKTMSVLKSMKANEKFPSRRIDGDDIVCDSKSVREKPKPEEIPGLVSCQKRGSKHPNEEASRQEKEQDGKRDSNNRRQPNPPVKEQNLEEKRGMKHGKTEKAKSSRSRSPGKANCNTKSSQRSEDQGNENTLETIRSEDRTNCTKREVSPQKTRNSSKDQMKKEPSTPVQRSKKTVCNQQSRTPSQSCGARKRSAGMKSSKDKPRKPTETKFDKNSAAGNEDVMEINTTCHGNSYKIEMNMGNEDPNFTEENASESLVGVSNSFNGNENSGVLSPQSSKMGTETGVQKLDFGGFGTGNHIKSMLLKSPSLVSLAKDISTVASEPSAPLRKPNIADSISPSERLLIDYAAELMECRALYPSNNSTLIVTLGSPGTLISIDSFLEEVLKGIDNLSIYATYEISSPLLDDLYARLKRDLSVERKSVSRTWNVCWTKGSCLEDVGHIVNEVEEEVLDSVIEETLTDLMK